MTRAGWLTSDFEQLDQALGCLGGGYAWRSLCEAKYRLYAEQARATGHAALAAYFEKRQKVERTDYFARLFLDSIASSHRQARPPLASPRLSAINSRGNSSSCGVTVVGAACHGAGDRARCPADRRTEGGAVSTADPTADRCPGTGAVSHCQGQLPRHRYGRERPSGSNRTPSRRRYRRDDQGHHPTLAREMVAERAQRRRRVS